MVSSYLKYSTTATKPCSLSASGFMAYHYTSVVLVHGVATTRWRQEIFSLLLCALRTLPNALLLPSTSTQASTNYCLGFCCFQFLKTKSISSSDRVGGPSIHSLRVWSRVSSSNILRSRVFVSFISLKSLSTVDVDGGERIL